MKAKGIHMSVYDLIWWSLVAFIIYFWWKNVV
nr:MAG TPA: hypothetical protein [Caudoviricetes sp.]